MAGLYLHVPFCRRKCGYCDFYSVVADDAVRTQYAQRLCELLLHPLPASAAWTQPFSTVYFGGGTPPLLGAKGIASVLDAAQRSIGVSDHAEITLECNPESPDAAFLRDAAAAGVNRLSFGLQTVHSPQLRRLGRAHDAADAARVVREARRAGIHNISLDVMLALPGQTEDSLAETIDFCLAQDVPHLSAYLLKIEPGTPFARENVGAQCPDEDAQAALYLYAVDRFERAGLRQYEISNFARPGYESRHNLLYWTLEDYLGIGSSAHSFFSGRRWAFPPSLEEFLAAPDAWSLLKDCGEGGDWTETVMLRLRLREGLPLSLAERFGEDPSLLLTRAEPLLRAGLLRREGDSLSLTGEGFLVSNSVIGALLGF